MLSFQKLQEYLISGSMNELLEVGGLLMTQSISRLGHGKGLPPLAPVDIVEGRENRIHRMPPSEDRWKIRSETYRGIAQAMADQWGVERLRSTAQSDLFSELAI